MNGKKINLLVLLAAVPVLALAAFAADETVPFARYAQSGATPPSLFGRLTSRRWAYGEHYVRENLRPVPNPNPGPEPKPRRDHPFDLAVSQDGNKVYIALLGSELRPGSEVAVYDVAKDEIIRRIALKIKGEKGPPASAPFHLRLHPDGRFLIVTSRFSNFASVIDTKTDKVVAEIPLDFYAQDIVFAQDGRRAFVANRYLDQVFVVDIQADKKTFTADMRVLGGLDDKTFFARVHPVLVKRCGSCHADPQKGEFYAGEDAVKSLLSAVPHVRPGEPEESILLRAALPVKHGGYADRNVFTSTLTMRTVVFAEPDEDPDYRQIRDWIAAAGDGPGIPVGNPHSKPKELALSTDGKLLFVGNAGTQDISIVSTEHLREVGGIYIQNGISDLQVYHSTATGRDYLMVGTQGVGFGTTNERDPYGGESRDPENPAAQYTVLRDSATGRVLPKDEQNILGPFDAVDGTAGIKFRDIQNDVVFIDVGALELPQRPPAAPDGLPYLLRANRYEAHRGWTRYTSDTAESTHGDIKGDIPPDLMRVIGATPAMMALDGDRLLVNMQSTSQVQEWRINPTAADPSNYLIPERVYETGLLPIGLVLGRPGTPSAGKAFTANFLGGTLSVIDRESGESREVVIDPGIPVRPFPDTSAERGELFAHTSFYSSDGDTSCAHCHNADTGDGRPWGVSQVLGQEYVQRYQEEGQFIIGGTMNVPQMRGLFGLQPFFFEGVISGYEPRSMIMEHNPADDFRRPVPDGDYTGIEADFVMFGVDDVQSSMSASTDFRTTLEERRDEMFRNVGMRHFGKGFTLRDFQRFVGEWQMHEPRLMPNPFDPRSESVRRGLKLYQEAQLGCNSCHPPPHFAKKDLDGNRQQAITPQVLFTERDAAFTLIGMNYLDTLNDYKRDLEPWDKGRVEETQGHITILGLRGLWDRPPVFLHNGLARTLRESVSARGHMGLRKFKYEPLLGGEAERPGRREVGFNETFAVCCASPQMRASIEGGSRIGFDTHGGTSQLSARELDDLVNFLRTIE
ncbi:MAG: hypothetical protein ABIJ96_16790 [Elusimicrobiota bacterium]